MGQLYESFGLNPRPADSGDTASLSYAFSDDRQLIMVEFSYGSVKSTFTSLTIGGLTHISRSPDDRRFFQGASPVFGGTTDTIKFVLADPTQLGFDYQTFGVWNYYSGSPSIPHQVSGLSVGAETAGGAIPTSATATFRGAATVGGYGSDDLTYGNRPFGNMSFDVDFAKRSGAIEISGFCSRCSITSLNGTLSWRPGTNLLSGELTSNDGFVKGPAQARFFGPGAEEVGGVFSVRSDGGSATRLLTGAFGGKR